MYEVEENSSSLGTIVLGIELILSSPILHSFLKETFNLHTAICLLIDLIAIITIFMLCVSNGIIRFIVALIYSVIWFYIVRLVTSDFTNSDKIWMLVNGIIAFLISFFIHMSLGWWSDYDFIIRKR